MDVDEIKMSDCCYFISPRCRQTSAIHQLTSSVIKRSEFRYTQFRLDIQSIFSISTTNTKVYYLHR